MAFRLRDKALLSITATILTVSAATIGGAEAGTPEVHSKIASTKAKVAQNHQDLRASVRLAGASTPTPGPRVAQGATQGPIRAVQEVAPPVKKRPIAPVAVNDPRSNVQLGRIMCFEAGFGEHWNDLYALWQAESGWDHLIYNHGGSGAYGIPQALPGSKMASHGADWKTNPRTQIAWGLNYIRTHRNFSNPTEAYEWFKANGSY